VPELPEVETVVRDLRPLLLGQRIAAVAQPPRRALRRPWDTAWNERLLGRTITAVWRRGKWIILDLEGGEHLVFHLGMTGQLTAVPAATELPEHTHLVFALAADGASEERQLRFRDVRRFGSATLFADREALEAFFARAGLGPEPFELKPADWRRRLAKTNRAIKAVLLDQGVVAGVGNIYADEALFQARLHPARRASDLEPAEAERLRRAVATVLRRAIERRGASIRDYVGGSGLPGGYQEEFLVYGRTGQPCPRCGTAIASMRLGGRSSHYCPACQQQPDTKAPGKTIRKAGKQEKE
jgi:formamidopyrimidine-DNA glycosylase